MTDPTAQAGAGTRRDAGSAPTAWEGVRRGWGRLPEPLREATLPFVVARVVVAGALGLAHFIVDRTHPSTPGVAARVHEGLLGWDAGWYESIARQGYAPLGHQSLRFFPAVPLLTHALAWVPGFGDGAALVLLANAAALAATAMLFLLARRETGSGVVARRSVWILSLLPAAFVLVMGYAESVLLVVALGCFLALRPPSSAGATRPHFAVAGLLAFAAALTRPIGVLLVLAVGAELVRWWPRLGRRSGRSASVRWRRPSSASSASWPGPSTWWATGGRRCASRSRARITGGSRIPSPRCTTTPAGCCTITSGPPSTSRGCSWPWPCSRSAGGACPRPTRSSPPASWPPPWPVPTSIRSSATPSSAFPLSIAAALVLTESQLERSVLALLAAGLAGYGLLAFLNISVP